MKRGISATSVACLFGIASVSVILACHGCYVDDGFAPQNPDDVHLDYSLRTQYLSKNPDYIVNVFAATKNALGQLGYLRTGETQDKERVIVHARAPGDTVITVHLWKKVMDNREGVRREWVCVSVRYGDWGNCNESQAIITKITANLK